MCRCGHSSFLSHGADARGEFEPIPLTCYACKEAAKAAKEDHGPGVHTVIRDMHDDPRTEEDERPEHPDIDLPQVGRTKYREPEEGLDG